MNIKAIALLTTLLLTNIFNTSYAKETPIILIDMEVYNLDNTKKKMNIEKETQQAIQAAKLESKPMFMIKLGKDATIEIGTQGADGEDIDMFRVQLTTHAIDNNYDIDIELTNKGAERVTSIADLAFNDTFAISTSINDITKLVKVTATPYETLALAQAARDSQLAL
jgi:hypothetical protein